jgi:Tol biopolymer transport system component
VSRAAESITHSPRFGNKPKLNAFLRYVVGKTLEGNQEHIKEFSIGIDALGYHDQHDPSSGVRVHAGRLRRLLSEYYAEEGRHDPVRIELVPGSYVPAFRRNPGSEDAESSKDERSAAPAPLRGAKRRLSPRHWAIALLVPALAGAVAVLVVANLARGPEARRYILRQVTLGSGLSDHGAAAAGGGLIVFSSSQAGEGGLDLWLAKPESQLAPVRLTRLRGDEVTPDLSPDGRWVVFRHNRGGGSLYVVPVTGGEERWIAGEGFSPRFSPDGRRIAYSVIEESGNSGVYVVPVEGGAPVRVNGGVRHAGCPVWGTDGSRLLVRAAAPDAGESYDWWLISTSPGRQQPVPVGAAAALAAIGISFDSEVCPCDWDGNHVIATIHGRLVQMRLDERSGRAGEAVVLHGGPGITAPRYFGRPARQAMILSSIVTTSTRLLTWRAHLNDGRVVGAHAQLIDDASLGFSADLARSSISADGRKLAYTSYRNARWQLWVRDLHTGVEIPAPDLGSRPQRPVLNPSGTRLMFFTAGPPTSAVWAADILTSDAPSGNPAASVSAAGISKFAGQGALARSPFCTDCGLLADWSSDERKILLIDRNRLVELDTRTLVRRVLIEGERYEPVHAVYSSDGKWIASVVGVAKRKNLQGVIFPSEGAPEAAWITVAEEPYALALRWAPAGNLVYFLSRRDDHRCLWARRLDARTKHPTGDAFAVAHFHRLEGRIAASGWLSLGGDRLALPVTSASSNLWLVAPR